MAPTKGKKTFGSAEAWTLFRQTGYAKPTHLQQRLIPIILKGRDVAVEAEGDSGKTAAFILPLSVKLKRGKAGIKAIVLTSSTENSHKIFREFKRFTRSWTKPSFFAFGFEGLTDTFTARYKIDGETIIAFLSKRVDSNDAQLTAESYYNFLIDNGGVAKPIANKTIKAKVVDFYGTTEIIFVVGPFVGGIHEAENQQAAEKLAAKLISKLGEAAKAVKDD